MRGLGGVGEVPDPDLGPGSASVPLLPSTLKLDVEFVDGDLEVAGLEGVVAVPEFSHSHRKTPHLRFRGVDLVGHEGPEERPGVPGRGPRSPGAGRACPPDDALVGAPEDGQDAEAAGCGSTGR